MRMKRGKQELREINWRTRDTRQGGGERERKGDEGSGEREVRSKMASSGDKELINGVGL